MSTDALLRALVYVLRRSPTFTDGDPEPGDLVVEVSGLFKPADPHGIGWLVAHDDAPYHAEDPLDGSVPMREVWDVVSLHPDAPTQVINGQRVTRWENARFVAVPLPPEILDALRTR
jgi:hypothetical protein